MKENVSIIFAAIIGTFLVVLLPLYSILDRQDSMSYNVVLTATTNFVDYVRNNGFIDKESYTNYIGELASTGNTYKVQIEAYKNVLIHATDENGNIIPDSYIEEKELYNTQDIVNVLEGEANNDVDLGNSNKKNNVYLFDENDEIYIKVYNTNTTAVSIIYRMLANVSDIKVIDIKYGGVINKVNWDLYDKIQVDAALAPEVVMSVPVNKNNSTNIQKVDNTGNTEYIDCTLINLESYVGETSIEDLCADYAFEEGQNYTYLYDLSKSENKTIKVAVELRRFEKINTGVTDAYEEIYTPISELTSSLFNGNGSSKSPKQYIIENYIRLNGMDANVDLELRKNGDYYVFNIILTDVRMSILDFISTQASITILPGLGQDENGTLSLGGETVVIELMDESLVNTVIISQPYIWNKLLSTKSLSESRITNNTVYSNQDIAFIISYTGINNHSYDEIIDAIRQNLKIYISDATYSELKFYTAEELNNTYKINIGTQTAGHVLVQFKYNVANDSNENHIKLEDNWISTNDSIIIDPETGEEIRPYAKGASSVNYEVLSDTLAPITPLIVLEGDKGNNDWYTSDVVLNLIASKNDMIIKNNTEQIGGSGVDKSTVTITGAIEQEETEQSSIVLSIDGISYATAKAYDFVGNVALGKSQTIKIDKTAPTAPEITLTGTKGINDWYISDVVINITPGSDAISGVEKTTYRIEGANALKETIGTQYTLTEEGKSVIIATTYDKAGNKTETELPINIEKTKPKEAKLEVISGEKNSPDNNWYATDVTLRITVDVGEALSGLGVSSYIITGDKTTIKGEFSETTHEITLKENGTYNITIYTRTAAGNIIETQFAGGNAIKIDKDAPNVPTLKVTKGTAGDNGWYISDVEVQVISNGDVGTSLESSISYTITNNQNTSAETRIDKNGIITFNQEGEYILKVHAKDNALNQSEDAELLIKIDKSDPTPAEFVITGTKGNDDWYKKENVYISHEGAEDSISGIKEVKLSHDSITENTTGTKVTLTTIDNAGHSVIKETTIKLDKSAPTKPDIKLLDQPTGVDEIFGYHLYNKNVSLKITPGIDTFITNIDNSAETTYEVILENSNDSQIEKVGENGTTIELTQEGKITVIARTYDKAGNVSETPINIWINKSKPDTPKILSINGVDVSGIGTSTIKGQTNTIRLVLDKIVNSNQLNVILIKDYNEVIKSPETSGTVDVMLDDEGTYRVIVTQTNIFGTTSDRSTGVYYYIYDKTEE